MTDHSKDDTEERLRAHLAQADAIRHASGSGGGLEAMLARISAETTTEAKERRAEAIAKVVSPGPAPVKQAAPTLQQLVELAIVELENPVRRPEAVALAQQLREALR